MWRLRLAEELLSAHSQLLSRPAALVADVVRLTENPAFDLRLPWYQAVLSAVREAPGMSPGFRVVFGGGFGGWLIPDPLSTPLVPVCPQPERL